MAAQILIITAFLDKVLCIKRKEPTNVGIQKNIVMGHNRFVLQVRLRNSDISLLSNEHNRRPLWRVQ